MQKVNFLKNCHQLNTRGCVLLRLSSTLGKQHQNAATDSNEQVQYQNYLFNNEKKRIATQKVPRIEKIQVDYQGHGISNSASMFMNKNLSTPLDCAMHISKNMADQTVIAKVSSKVEDSTQMPAALPSPGQNARLLETSSPSCEYWDACRELPFDCNIKFLNFQTIDKEDIEQVNNAYWRSCAMVLGATLNKAFKQKYSLGLLQIPQVSVESGAFCYDIELDESLNDWQPTQENLVYITKVARSIISNKKKFERLQVDTSFARKLFQDDKYRLNRIASNNPYEPLSLYRLDDYIEIVDGPLISNSAHFFHYVVTAFHTMTDNPNIRRVQGISLPQALKVHHSVWSMLENRARKLVKENLPGRTETNDNVDFFKHKSIEDETKVYTRSTRQWTGDKFLQEDSTITI